LSRPLKPAPAVSQLRTGVQQYDLKSPAIPQPLTC
jgi:hypothetical protein